MTVKPTTLPRWADVGGVIAVPPSGKQDVGWVAGENPPSAYFNWWQNLGYQWASFLNQLVTVAGVAQCDVNIASGGGATGTLTAAGVITANGGLTIPAGQSLKFGAREMPIAAAGFLMESGGTASLGDGVWTFGAVSVIAATIPLNVGDRITNVTLNYNRGGAGTITMTLCRKTDTTKTVVSTETINTGTGATTKAFTTPPNYTIATGEQIYVRVQCDNVAHAIYGLTPVGFDHP